MIDGSAAAPPLLLQLVLQQETKLTGIDVVVATKEALKMKKKRMEHKEVLYFVISKIFVCILRDLENFSATS
jgi:hypothetical protein